MHRTLTLALFVCVPLAAVGQSTSAAPRRSLAPGTPAASAQASAAPVDAAKEAKVKQLFVVMHLDRTMDQMMTMMKRLVDQQAQSLPGAAAMSPEQKKLMDQYSNRAMTLAMDTVGWKAMEPDYVRIYAANFTDAELDGMIAFYGSPAGQAMLDKTPQISEQTMGLVQGRMTALQPQMRALTDEFVKQMQESTKTPAPASSKAAPGTGK